MTTDQAKQVLLRYRPGLGDATDPEIAIALELAAHNSELHEWLAAHTAFQNSVRHELRQIRVPPDLKSKILAPQTVMFPFWQRRAFLTLAASIAILLAGMGYWFSAPVERQSLANFQSRMTGFALRTYAMDILTSDPSQVRAYLAKQGGPADYSLTPALSRTEVKGGGRLSWQNHPVGMVCFSLPQNETMYLFVMDRAVLHDKNLPENGPRVISGRHLTTATWTQGGKIYLLAAPIDAQTLSKFVEQNG